MTQGLSGVPSSLPDISVGSLPGSPLRLGQGPFGRRQMPWRQAQHSSRALPLHCSQVRLRPTLLSLSVVSFAVSPLLEMTRDDHREGEFSFCSFSCPREPCLVVLLFLSCHLSVPGDGDVLILGGDWLSRVFSSHFHHIEDVVAQHISHLSCLSMYVFLLSHLERTCAFVSSFPYLVQSGETS